MNDHLNDWWSKNSAKCGDKGFSQCYLDAAGMITWTCDLLSLSTCTPPPSGRAASYQSYQEFYTIWNIYTLNQYFANYHQALLNGQAEAIGVVGKIVDVVSPPKNVNPGTPFFGPIFGGTFGLLSGFAAFAAPGVAAFMAASMVGAVGGTPVGLVNLLFPKSTMTEVKWQDISASLSDFVDQYQKNVGEAATLIQKDFNTFYGVTHQGAFSAKISDSLPEKTSFLYRELMKWTFNQAVQARRFFTIKNPGVDPAKLENETSHFTCGGYDKYGFCNDNKYIFYDGKDSYGMARSRDVGADFFPDVLQVAFDRNWTTPQELFLDAQKCAFMVEVEQQANATELNIGCASNTPVCEVDMAVDVKNAIATYNAGPMFTNCPPMLGWGVSRSDNAAYIPFSYLGPLLKASDVVHNEKKVHNSDSY
ncbi:hypothetical protein DHEL01_v210001 [Diaporthe helianthi]|uniref:Uncharacterized protein n=1 Tax=Diaporthe helianthi TaxID=158607 RepID=A0A2P5HMW9_DIAHE|nr:hypothetical protein DHEL01_v210001 [Diaporthe helianthi]